MSQSSLPTKPAVASRRFWLNIAALVASGLSALIGTSEIQNYPRVAAGLTAIVSLLNLALLFASDTNVVPRLPKR